MKLLKTGTSACEVAYNESLINKIADVRASNSTHVQEATYAANQLADHPTN